jgi:hypothetical protein
VADYDFDFWQPLQPHAAPALFGGLVAPWWIAGGWAIDLFIGRETRAHEDLDIGVFRDDQQAIQAQLVSRGFELHCSDPPGTLRPWQPGEMLGERVQDVWCRRAPDAPWEFQLMLNPGGGDAWISRRDPAYSMPLSDALIERDGLRCLAPQIQLHFKAKSNRPKDLADLENALPLLDQPARQWLLRALTRTYPGHAWIARVAAATAGR